MEQRALEDKKRPENNERSIELCLWWNLVKLSWGPIDLPKFEKVASLVKKHSFWTQSKAQRVLYAELKQSNLVFQRFAHLQDERLK